MAEKTDSRRDTIDLLIVQILSTGLTLPVLSLFTVRLASPWLVLRLTPISTPVADLGLPVPDDVVFAGARLAEGLGVIAGVALALATLMLVVGCATAATLVHRAGVARREELGIRAAVGATRRDVTRMVVGPLSTRLAIGAVGGTALGLALLWLLWSRAPAALVLPTVPVSPLMFVAVIAPAWAAWVGARLDVRAVLRRFASPLTLESSTRLKPLGFGGAYFGLLVGMLATVAVLAESQSYADVASQEWTEARDTLLFEIESTGGESTLAMLDAVRATEPGREWHLVSAGALEGLGAASQETAECNCPMGTIYSPYTRLWAQRHSVTPGVFAAIGVPIVRGREFTADDGPEAERVIMIDAAHMRQFPAVDPIGKRIRMSGRGLETSWYRIIGIVDVPKPLDLATASSAIPGIYLSALQHPPSRGQLVTRVAGPVVPPAMAALGPAIASLGGGLRPLGTLADRLAMWAEPLAWFTFMVFLVSIGAFVVGVYGVTTLTWLDVRSRTPEFGVRRAVGARTRHIRRLILREVAEVAAVGAAIGAILGRGMAVGLADRFRAVPSLDPTVLVGVAAVLGLAAALAARRPARRAAAISPIEAIGDVS